jgi:hypothetical protein
MCPKATTGRDLAAHAAIFQITHRARLLDQKAQETYYNKIVARYMQFCSQHPKDLDEAFASLSLNADDSVPRPTRSDNTARPLRPGERRPLTPSPPRQAASGRSGVGSIPEPSSEMSIILAALRKLREGLLGSSSRAASPTFAQRVHVFNVRLAILAQHPESYHPSLLHLLSVLHSREWPLPRTELCEMTAYLILDLATRQNDLSNAYALRYNSRVKFGFENRNVDMLLHSIASNDWLLFWRVRRKVDGYLRAILGSHAEKLRKTVLKAVGRSYMVCDIKWILRCAADNELTWDELVQKEDVGWIRDGEKAIIRKPKLKPPQTSAT